MWHLRAQIQALQAIQPIHTLAIDRKAFASQQNVDARITIAYAYRSDLFNPRTERDIEIADMRLVIVRRFIDVQEAARASYSDIERGHEKAGAIALLRRLYSFFVTIS